LAVPEIDILLTAATLQDGLNGVTLSSEPNDTLREKDPAANQLIGCGIEREYRGGRDLNQRI